MRYLQLTEADLASHPNLERLIWPDLTGFRAATAVYYIPEDHANIALIACASSNWVIIPITSNRLARTLI
jgi:hypothetical protein